MITIPVSLLSGVVFGTLLWVLSPLKVTVVVLGMVSIVIIMRKPILGLLLFGFIAPFIPYATVTLGIRITVSEAILAVTWLGVFWQLLIHKFEFPNGATEKALMVLIVFSCIPFFIGQLIISAEGNGLVNWVRWILNLSVLFLVAILVDSKQKRDQLIIFLLLGILANLLLSIGLFLKERDAQSMIPILTSLKYSHPEAVKDIFSGNFTRMASPWVHPNLTGGALVLFLPLAFFYGLSEAGFRRKLGFLVAFLSAIGLMLSISRGAIISLVLVLAWLAYLRVPYSSKMILWGGVLAVLLVAFYPPLQDRLSTMFSSTNASTEVRLDEYRQFPEAVAKYPFGIGFKVDPPVPDSGLIGISNLWLNVVYKIGFIGLILYLAVSAIWWRETRPKKKVATITRENGVWLGSHAGILAAFATGLFDHYFSFTMVLISLFWLLVGLNLKESRELGYESSSGKAK
ncbi:MAG: hypothetical protein AXW17_13025 [Colwellia sp. Phe_37]|nr:MAG: hypothetical protein AXW17_13025 [Colwellia sp. Phe_37]